MYEKYQNKPYVRVENRVGQYRPPELVSTMGGYFGNTLAELWYVLKLLENIFL